MIDDKDFFLKQMTGVTPIKKTNRVNKNNSKTPPKSPKQPLEIEKNNIKKTYSKKIKKTDFGFEKISIKKGIKKRLYKIDKKIDFHGESLLKAEEIFSKTINESFYNNKRCLLFVTGKGLYRKNYEDNHKPKLYHGVIRLAFLEWIKSKKLAKFILSYEQASIDHGGDGAFYVYLRKHKN